MRAAAGLVLLSLTLFGCGDGPESASLEPASPDVKDGKPLHALDSLRDAEPGGPDFAMEEILSNVTGESVSLALVPAEALELEAEYGPSPEDLSQRVGPRKVGAGELVVFELTGLDPGREYAYRVRVRRAGETASTGRKVHSFRTLHTDRGARVRLAYAADSHITGRWVRSRCGEQRRFKRHVANFDATLDHIAEADVDFLIAGGDNFMTHAPGFRSCDEWTSLGQGTVRTPEEADLRYEVALSPGLWGKLARRLPLFLVLGNHDGEARFGDARGSYGHFEDTRELSRGARLRHLPDPTRVYPGSENGDLYFSFTSGDARFIVLDVMSGPDHYPASAEDWTLGPDQLRWFEEVLALRDRTWTLVFSEHLVGGVDKPRDREPAGDGGSGVAYHYGRGGMLSTRDGTAAGEFLGEQAKLQRLMREAGVDLFFHAHDHLAVVGEKQNEKGEGEGVYYVMAGQASGGRATPGWAEDSWYRRQLDYDGDGKADYLSGRRGARGPGFYRIDIEGGSRLDVSYVRSDTADPERNGSVAFRFSLLPDGSLASEP